MEFISPKGEKSANHASRDQEHNASPTINSIPSNELYGSHSHSSSTSNIGSASKSSLLGNIAIKIGNLITSPLKWRIRKEDDDEDKEDDENENEDETTAMQMEYEMNKENKSESENKESRNHQIDNISEMVDEEITINAIKIATKQESLKIATKQESLKNIYYAAQSTSDQGNVSQEIAPELSLLNSYSISSNDKINQYDHEPADLLIQGDLTLSSPSFNSNSNPNLKSSFSASFELCKFGNQNEMKSNDENGNGIIENKGEMTRISMEKRIEQSTCLLDLDLIQSPKSILRYSQRDFDKIKDDLEQEHCQKMEILQMEIHGIHGKYSNSLQTIQELRSILSEYERTMSQMLQNRQSCHDEKGIEGSASNRGGNGSNIDYEQILQEKRNLTIECQTLQIQLCNLYQKYEEGKKLTILQQQKNVLNGEIIERLNKELEELKIKFQNQKEISEQKLLEQHDKHLNSITPMETELIATKAKLTRTELRIASLETALENKTKENQELMKICDELIQKMS